MDIRRPHVYLRFFLIIYQIDMSCLAPYRRPVKKAQSMIVVSYYASWERQGFDQSRIDGGHLRHISHAFAQPDLSGNRTVDRGYLNSELTREAQRHNVWMIICYDDEQTVSLKCCLVKEKQVAGINIWELSADS